MDLRQIQYTYLYNATDNTITDIEHIIRIEAADKPLRVDEHICIKSVALQNNKFLRGIPM